MKYILIIYISFKTYFWYTPGDAGHVHNLRVDGEQADSGDGLCGPLFV